MTWEIFCLPREKDFSTLSVSLAADSSPKGGAWGYFPGKVLPPPLGEVARRSCDGEGGAFLFVLSSSPPQRTSLLLKGGAPVRTLGRRIVFRRRRNVRSKQGFANLVYCVCFASQNAILSQPSADSPFQRGLRTPATSSISAAAHPSVRSRPPAPRRSESRRTA